MSDLELNLWWEPRDPSQADDARRLSRFVSGLPDFDPIYRSWLNSPETKTETVPVPLSEAAAKQLLIDNVARGDAPPDPWPEQGSYVWGATRDRRPSIFAKRATPTPSAMSAPSVGMPPSIRITSSCDCRGFGPQRGGRGARPN
jgi:hypothetical protein